MFEKCLAETGDADEHNTKFFLEHTTHVIAVFVGVHEAARVAKPRDLLEGRCYRSRRRSGFGNGVVDFLPDEFVVFVIEDCIQERLDTLNVEIVRDNCQVKAREVAEDGVPASLGTKQRRGPKDLQCREQIKSEILEICMIVRRAPRRSWAVLSSWPSCPARPVSTRCSGLRRLN
jgi:hypothetical protein